MSEDAYVWRCAQTSITCWKQSFSIVLPKEAVVRRVRACPDHR